MDFEENEIFKKLKDIREDLDMTQKDIAEKMHVAQGVYSRWERSKEIIPLKRLISFCNITGYKMDYIVGLTNSDKKNPIIKEIDSAEVGARLRSWREKKGITQKDLAIFLNTTQSTISAYENGKVLILTAFAYQIAKQYKISMDWLCCRSNQQDL